MPVSQGRSRSGESKDIRLGRHGDQLVSPAHGKYAEAVLNGTAFYASTVAGGVVLPLQTTLTPTVMIWNPSDSGVDCVLQRYVASHGSVDGPATRVVLGLVAVSTLVSVGSNIATGNLITAFAENVLNTNTFNAKLNSGNRPRVKSSTQGTNTITAGTWIKAIGGIGLAVATTSVNAFTFNYDFDGEMVLPPGTAIHVATHLVSSMAFVQTLSWYEVPAS